MEVTNELGGEFPGGEMDRCLNTRVSVVGKWVWRRRMMAPQGMNLRLPKRRYSSSVTRVGPCGQEEGEPNQTTAKEHGSQTDTIGVTVNSATSRKEHGIVDGQYFKFGSSRLLKRP